MAEEARGRASSIGQGRLGLVDPGRPRAMSPRAQTYLSPPGSRAMLKFATVAVLVRNEKRARERGEGKVGFRGGASFPPWVTGAPRGADGPPPPPPPPPPERRRNGVMFS